MDILEYIYKKTLKKDPLVTYCEPVIAKESYWN